jgi:hypothetical protein
VVLAAATSFIVASERDVLFCLLLNMKTQIPTDVKPQFSTAVSNTAFPHGI